MSPAALSSLLFSCPSQLEVLDLGDTTSDGDVLCTVLERQPQVTHLRICRCTLLENAMLYRLIQMPKLQVGRRRKVIASRGH